MVRPSCAGKRLGLLALSATLAIALAAPAAGNAAAKRATVNFKTVVVGAAGNPSVGIVPFTDAIYQSCDGAPSGCITVGGVDYPYRIAQLEVTVKQWVKFLNTVDPDGNAKRGLYKQTESSAGWPKYGSINRSSSAPSGMHYSVAYPEWNDKPYGFADFLQSARFANSLQNGRLLSKEKSSKDGFDYVTYKVRLSRDSRTGMYDLDQPDAHAEPRLRVRRPEPERVDQGGLLRPERRRHLLLLEVPDQRRRVRRRDGDGAERDEAQSRHRRRHQRRDAAARQLPRRRAAPPRPGARRRCSPEATAPARTRSESIRPPTRSCTQGSVSTVGQAAHHFAVGHARPGRQRGRVDGHDHRRRRPGAAAAGSGAALHGGIANAPGYQLWLSAVGLQPQRNPFYDRTYPWLGFRIGTIGKLKVDG